MAEIKKLTAEHYDELLALLNYTFGNKNGKEVDFLTEQPKMWVRDDTHMGCHLGTFEDGKLCAVVGVYPLQTVIDGEKFLFATTGNVATLPEYEGRGYFTALFTEAMKELEKMGADAARLGGARQRYGRFGYEGCGTSYLFTFDAKNRTRGFSETAGKEIVFSPIAHEDTEALAFCRSLRVRLPIYVERPMDGGGIEVYRSMCSKNKKPYLATRDGAPVGYICCGADGKDIGEFDALDTATKGEMICAWQAKVPERIISFSVPVFDREALRMFCATAESYRLTYPSRFKMLCWDRVAGAMMRYHARENRLLDGEWVFEIRGYGKLCLFVREGVGGCEKTKKDASLSFDCLTAARLLFGPTRPEDIADLPPIPRSWLPLPFSWGLLDAI